MIRAAATGRLNYKEAVSGDEIWLLKEQYVLDAIEVDMLISYTAGKQLQQVATAVWPSGDTKGELYKTNYERGNAHLKLIGQLSFPYWKWDEKAYYKSEMAQMRAEYIAKYGDPSTPEARAQAKKDEETVKRNALIAEQHKQTEAVVLQRRTDEIQRLRSKRVQRRR